MKKLRIFILSILFLMASMFFVACKKDDSILAEKIELSETDLVLQLGETAEIDVVISPQNASNKKFQIVDGYDVNVVGVNYDLDNMKIYITARDFITANLTETIIGVRTTDDSDKEEHIHVLITEENQSVSTPKNLLFDGQKLSWQFVDRAVGYEISINDNIYVLSDAVNQYAIDLNEYAGQKVIAKVKANGVSRNLDSAWTSELEFTILARPENISYSDETKLLSWDAVENAVSYNVYVNDRPLYTRETSISLEDSFVEEGQYDIRVMAVGTQTREYVNSAFSNSVIITKLSTIREFNIQNGVVFWSTVEGATSYEIEYNYKSNGVETTHKETVVSTRFTLPTENIDAGTYGLKIKAIGNGKTTITGDYGIERKWTKLAKIENLRVEDGDVVWDANNLATSYTIYFENMVDAQGDETTEVVSQITGSIVRYNISKYSAGEYRLNVVANGTSDKISGDKCDQSINVVKLQTPQNIQVSKSNGNSVIMWDNNSLASNFVLTFKTGVSAAINIDIPQTDKVSYNISDDNLDIGSNLISIQAIGGGNNNGKWYINSDVSVDYELIKLNAPTFNSDNIATGKLSWTFTGNNNACESFTLKVLDINGDEIFTETISNNFIDLNSRLSEGDYQAIVKANAKTNLNYYDSAFSDAILLHKLGVGTISMFEGTVSDLQGDEELNYTYQYILSNKSGAISSIEGYLDSQIRSGEKFSVKAQAIPVLSSKNNTYYIQSDYSNMLYLQKLPTITDVSMDNGILYYGKDYASLSGYKFMLKVSGQDEAIENGTNILYDFRNMAAGKYTVSISAASLSSGTECDEDNPLNIDSNEMQRGFAFEKLAAPTQIRINSMGEDNTTIGDLVWSLSRYTVNSSGNLRWSEVAGAVGYELIFDNGSNSILTSQCKISLQNTQIASGSHNVTIKSIGNGKEIISSEVMKVANSNETYRFDFEKVKAPTNIQITNGRIHWTYANSSDDPNAGISHMGMFDALGTSHPLLNPDSKIVTYVLVDGNGNMYSGLDLSDVDLSTVTDISSGLAVINAFIDALKANSCELPANINSSTEISVFAVPFNCYISSITNFTVGISNTLYVIGDYSPKLRLTMLEAPQGLTMYENKLSWSGLRYNKIDGKTPIKEYQVTIKEGSKNYVFSVREDSTKTYQIDAANKIIYINDLSNSDLCYWNFNKTSFENFFGANTYKPAIFAISIKAIANIETYTDDGGRTYYYVNSHASRTISTEVFEVPVIRVENGIVAWNFIEHAVGYRLYINTVAQLPEETSQYIDLDNKTSSYVLGSNYPAGVYYINVRTLGDGINNFTAEFNLNNEKEVEKLTAIQNIYVENGVIKFSQNNIIGTEGSNDGAYHYTMLVRSSDEDDKDDTLVNNDKYLIYELGDEFVGGKRYYIRVVATGDNERYISSDPSNYCYVNVNELPLKLASPVSVSIIDGNVTWQSVPYSSKYNVTVAGQSKFTQETYFDISDIEAGTYSVYVKAIGDNRYLNSVATEKANVRKLSDITGLSLENGALVWDYVTNSNYVISVSGTLVQINSNNSQVANNRIKYSFDTFDVGNYQVYLFNNGGENAISSSKTDTIRLTKLSTPVNLSITDEKLVFDEVPNANKYFIIVKVGFDNNTLTTYTISSFDEADITSTEILFTSIKSYIESLTTLKIVSYEIKVAAVGSTENNPSTITTYYITSNSSTSLVIAIPASPVIQAQFTTSGAFSGKVYWSAIENADYYKVYIKYYDDSLNDDQSKIQIFDAIEVETDKDHSNRYKTFKTTNTYLNLAYAGVYDIVVAASPNKDGYLSKDSNALSNIEYNMFAGTENGQNIPYTISTMEQFNAIQYNLDANYVLGVSVFNIENLETICDAYNMFKGTFDGNAATINLNIPGTNSTFIGLFAYVAASGVVKNFTLNADIHSIAQTDSAIYVGSVAGFNYGTIQNIVVNGTVSSEYNNDTVYIYNGGVVAVNYGTISSVLSKASVLPKNNSNSVYAGGIATINSGSSSKIEFSGFRGIASAQIVGGIVSQNLAGKIDQCYYETDSTIQTAISSGNDGRSYNCAGGIAGYMNGGTITYCYANGKVTGTSYSQEKVYVGGLVGYADRNSRIGTSFVVGYNSQNVEQISASGDYSYRGVFVGDSYEDCSASWLICVKTDVQKFIGNSKKTLSYADSTTNLKTTIRNKMNATNYFEVDDDQTVYPYLKNAKYN